MGPGLDSRLKAKLKRSGGRFWQFPGVPRPYIPFPRLGYCARASPQAGPVGGHLRITEITLRHPIGAAAGRGKRSPNVTCPGRGATRSGAKWCAAEPGPLRTPRPGKSHRSGPPSDSKRHPPNAHCRFGRVPLFKPQVRVIAPVAQLDRALPSEGKGQRFESSRARQ